MPNLFANIGKNPLRGIESGTPGIWVEIIGLWALVKCARLLHCQNIKKVASVKKENKCCRENSLCVLLVPSSSSCCAGAPFLLLEIHYITIS